MSAAPAHTEHPLDRLIFQIEALFDAAPSPEPALLARALAGPIDAADLAPFVRFAEDRYTRNRVASGEGWELRLLCWSPGQTSALHGHGRSGCAFRVLSGVAEELRLGGQRRLLQAGAVVTAGEGDVHQVGNVGDAPLLTLHLYAPALPVDQPSGADGDRVVVIGGGFCGAALAVHLLRRGGPGLRVTLVERSGEAGRGVAYGTSDPVHLLNVPAAKMSLDPSDPEAFLRFAHARGVAAQATDLLPRTLYGAYVEETLADAVRQHPGRLRVAAAEAIDVEPEGVRLSDGRLLPADQVVLATGHLPPRWPEGLPEAARRDARVLRDAWEAGALDGVGLDERVLVVGTGLTAVDVLLSLRARGQRGLVWAVSRHGRWPQPHLPHVAWTGPAPRLPWPAPTEAHALAAWLEGAVAEAGREGIPWQAVIDAFRPHISKVWGALPLEERAVFLAEHRSRWEVVRHRAPAASLRALSEWQARGQLRSLAGEIRDVQTEGPLVVTLSTQEGPTSLEVDRIILCNGADTDVRHAANPALVSLLARGRVRADALGLGLEVEADGRAIDAEGRANPDLWVLGAARRPLLWETTAVPELSRQAAALAVDLEVALAAAKVPVING